MRPFIVAMVGLLAISPTAALGDVSETAAKKSPVLKSKNATANEPIREFGPSDFAKGYIVAIDERTNSFDLRTAAGVVRAKNPEWLVHLDRYGAPLPEMTLSKLKERHYYLTVRTGGLESSGSFKFFFTVEALP